MPSTATTNLTIPTILDLIGPLAAAQANGKNQPAFEALLHPPLRPSAPPDTASDEDNPRSAPPDTRGRPHRARNPNESDSAAQRAPNDRGDEGASASGDATDEDSSAPRAVETDRPSELASDPAAAVDHLVSQSLAGLDGRPPFASEAPPAGAGLNADQAQVNEHDAAGPFAKSKGNPRRTPNSQVNAAAPAATDFTVQTPADKAAASDLEAAGADAATSDPLATDKTAVQQLGKANGNGRPDATISGDADGEQLPAVEAALQPADSSNQRQPDESRQDQQPIDSESALSAVASAEAAAPTPAQSASPAAAALAPAAQRADAPPASRNAAQAPAVTASGSSPRSRLPAEHLAQPAGSTQRRGQVEVDAPRLLSRVARAFAAAQERDGEIRLRLSPPELGSLRLEIRIRDGALVAHLQTETDAARVAIVENLPALRERLAEQGVRIERFDVDLMHRQSGGSPNQSSGGHQDAPPAAARVAAPPRRAAEPAASSLSLSTVDSTSGLNVVI